jgi:hypothetical protein
MEEATIKQLIGIVIESQKDMKREIVDIAKKQSEMSTDFATYISKNERQHSVYDRYLTDDKDTDTTGAITHISNISKRVSILEEDKKITYGKIGAVSTVVLFLGGAIWAVFSFFAKLKN